MKTSLVIMAAGLGSRFGSGIKQLEPVGMNGEIIMDYSIHDALEAGFNKIIFIIRKDIEKEFREVIGNRIEKICSNLDVEVAYAYQSLDCLPDGIKLPVGRKKPWGTGQAVLAAKEMIKEPFVVINADDYYGKEAFIKIYQFLKKYTQNKSFELCMAGFILKNTLSDHGGVTRGICTTDERGFLTAVQETHNIVKILKEDEVYVVTEEKEIDPSSLVSMNMWGLTPEFLELLEEGFTEFFCNIEKGSEEELKSEYLLPIFMDQLLKKEQVNVQVLKTHDKWFGVTYKEDKDIVIQSFKNLINNGIYKKDLFSDLKKDKKIENL